MFIKFCATVIVAEIVCSACSGQDVYETFGNDVGTRDATDYSGVCAFVGMQFQHSLVMGLE